MSAPLVTLRASRPARLRALALLTLALLGAGPRAARAADVYGPEPAVTPTPAEAAALALARSRFAIQGARPQVSGALVVAARRLASDAARGGDPLDRRALRNALAHALAYDPAPMAFTVRASADAWEGALARALGKGGASHVGAGVAEDGDERVVVVLASRRGARLDAFPRTVTAGERIRLSGQLRSGLCNARAFLTRPSGEVQSLETRGRVWFQATVPLAARGRYLVEVMAEGPQGPTVAALFPVAVGGASYDEPPAPPRAAARAEPADLGRAEALVVDALNATRARHGLGRLAPDAALAAVARRHSEAMRAAGAVSHVLPGEAGPAERLGRAGIRFRRFGENVAAATTAAEAQDAVEESPAHLQNVLEPHVRRVGVGLARDAASGRVYLTEVLVE